MVRDYEAGNESGIGISVLDRKFYREFTYDESYLTDNIASLKKEGYLQETRPFQLTEKGRQILSKRNV